MGSYSVRWKKSAEQEIRRLDRRFILQILSAVEPLAEDPFPARCRKLKGSESSYRIRVGDYRVVYQVDSRSKTVTVYHVRHRRDVYRRR